MKIKKLIRELREGKKICLVEPSKEISKSYSLKSERSFDASKLLLSQGFFEESISMSYYAMYNRVLGLFYLVGIKSENHSITISLLKEVFNIENKYLIYAKDERINKQYYPNTRVSTRDSKELLDIAEDFITELENFIDKISNKEIESYRNKFLEMTK